MPQYIAGFFTGVIGTVLVVLAVAMIHCQDLGFLKFCT